MLAREDDAGVGSTELPRGGGSGSYGFMFLKKKKTSEESVGGGDQTGLGYSECKSLSKTEARGGDVSGVCRVVEAPEHGRVRVGVASKRQRA